MYKIISIILLLLFLLVPHTCLACEEHSDIISSPVPSITIDDLCYVSGQADIPRNSKFDYFAMIRSFSDDIIDCIPLFLYPTENNRHIFFTLTYPVPEMEYDCFIIDADCNLIGNITCEYLLCTCGEWWYDINIILAPNKYELEQVVYLVWVK